MITIEKCSNGYVLYRNEMEDDQIKEIDSVVFEEQGDDKRHIQSLLYEILEAIGEIGNGGKEQIRITRINANGSEVSNIPDSI